MLSDAGRCNEVVWCLSRVKLVAELVIQEQVYKWKLPAPHDLCRVATILSASAEDSLGPLTYTSRGYGCGIYNELIFVESKALK